MGGTGRGEPLYLAETRPASIAIGRRAKHGVRFPALWPIRRDPPQVHRRAERSVGARCAEIGMTRYSLFA